MEKRLFNGIFSWMAIGLFLTAGISYLVSQTPGVLSLLVSADSITVLGYLVMFAPLAFVLVMSLGFTRLPFATLLFLYLSYAALMGASLAFIFLVYTNESIFATFLTTGLMFGLMAFIGFVTKVDLSKLGNILLMGLLGIIIASVINVFIRNDSFSLIISFISIIIFCGLTAWDVQKLKALSEENTDGELTPKLGILGALTLYLDFINIFLSLLRFTGKKRR